MAEGPVGAMAGKGETAGAKAWLALVDDIPTSHFTARAAFDPS